MSHSSFIPSLSDSQGNADEARLKRLALQWVKDYPDIYGMAYAEAGKILRKHGSSQLDPEKVYWHRFSNARSSPRTFTGWDHFGTPVESLSLVELVMHRFSARDQEATDELQVYGGFYTDGPKHGTYDERNEVRLLPADVLKDFWALNFSAHFWAANESFWEKHGSTFVILARSRFLAAAVLQRSKGSLSREDFLLLTDVVIGKLPAIMTLDKLAGDHVPRAGISLRTFDVGGRLSAECFRVVEAGGRQILYIPGEEPAFHAFASDEALYQWVQGRAVDEQSRKSLEKLFLRSEAMRQLHGPEFQRFLQRLGSQAWNPQRPIVNQHDVAIADNVFVYLRDIAHREMSDDATALLTSNASLRKQMWISYLNAFLHVFGAWAPLGWPVALTLVGAGSANLVLNVDQALHGRTAGQRKSGVIGAICNAIFTVFNLPMLAGLARAGELAQAGEQADVLSLGAGDPEPTTVASPGPVEGVELHDVQLESATQAVPMEGIEQLGNGQTWISLNDMPHAVRYSPELRGWKIVDDAGPGVPEEARLVRLNGSGEWELASASQTSVLPVEQAGAELGNELPDAPTYRTVSSTFWDRYMRFDLADEERLSRLGMARQKAILSIQEAEPDGELISDSEGGELYVDAWGDEHQVFRTSDGRHVSGVIPTYTARSEAFNRFLRTGVAEAPDQVALIRRLDRDLAAIGYNNDVTLFRGGSQARGTSGLAYRSGKIRRGDVLVNTDVTSFSENPYLARVFASSQAGQQSSGFVGEITFDDSSIVFELPVGRYFGATPIAPFSGDAQEVESLFMPGHYFEIESIEQLQGAHYRFMRVLLVEMVGVPKPGRGIFDLRTGEPFSRSQYAQMLGAEGAEMVDYFFPMPD